MCVLADHQPANHQDLELSVTKEISTDAKMPEEHSAQPISTEFVGVRRQRTSENSNKVMFVGIVNIARSQSSQNLKVRAHKEEDQILIQ